MQIDNQKDIQRYYDALVRRDEQFVGIFYVGVKTTGIFCISTCRARKPKFENVLFYNGVQDVLRAGFRPCKVCKPTNHTHEPPADVKQALQLLKDSEGCRVNDHDLRSAGLAPEKIRRWFNKNHGITFQAYQRMIRINTAYQSLKSGKKVTDVAYESGYESLSGFGYTFKKLTGKTPDAGLEKSVILIHRLTTPLGPMYACATDRGICLLEFTDRRMLETEFEDLQKRLDATILVGTNEHIQQLVQELQEYFDGSRISFDVSLHTPSTPFREQVWTLLQDIPYGKTVSYMQQAIKIGNPKAVRAVASANGHNRVAIVIPCHRVVGSDGSLTGYAGGLDRKKWLLQHEGAWDKNEQLTMF